MAERRRGYNLAVFSRHATRMWVLLFEVASAAEPCLRIELDPSIHRTGDIWHVLLIGDLRGKLYALQADGPDAPTSGHRFDPTAVLLDPYATAVIRANCTPPSVTAAAHRYLGVIGNDEFDWQGDSPPRHPWSETVIYETHVRGLTRHPSAGAHHAGQYLGVLERVDYLKSLGVTTLELMPIQAFDHDVRAIRQEHAAQPLRNYWGYNPIALFAPEPEYSSAPSAAIAGTELKTLIRELHKAGIEVIMDVVFNHTAEGDETGPTYSFRGLDNAVYYIRTAGGVDYADFTGCGNTLNCNHPVVRRLIIDCLRHWTTRYHIDGFRFDLASILGRDSSGALVPNPPLLREIAEDPLLREAKLIAEAWDWAGAFQVGHFADRRWAEWNSFFRNDVRQFWRGDANFAGRFATRLCGSADLYEHAGEAPINSINFVTSHDGFTLNDLVSYSAKHNEANGEANRDGTNENLSCNYGAEGSTEDAEIEVLRSRHIRNLLATLFLSRGVPMLLGGDEFRRTQAGNNNAYCQDNEISWYDWRLVERHADLVRFVRRLAELRRAHPVLRSEKFYSTDEITWLAPEGQPVDWECSANCIGCVVVEEQSSLCLLFNATPETVSFVLPASAAAWRTMVDTSARPPGDAPDRGHEPVPTAGRVVWVRARSTMVLVADRAEAVCT